MYEKHSLSLAFNFYRLIISSFSSNQRLNNFVNVFVEVFFGSYQCLELNCKIVANK